MRVPYVNLSAAHEPLLPDLLQNLLEQPQIPFIRLRVHVTAVSDSVEADARNTIVGEAANKRRHLIDMAVDVAIGKQPQEVKGRIVGSDSGDEAPPRLTPKK